MHSVHRQAEAQVHTCTVGSIASSPTQTATLEVGVTLVPLQLRLHAAETLAVPEEFGRLCSLPAGSCRGCLLHVGTPCWCHRLRLCLCSALPVSCALCLRVCLSCVCRCMGERSEAVQQEFEAELDSIAARLCTCLTTLHECPAIRYRVGKPPEHGDAPGAAARSMLAQHLAQKVGGRTEPLGRG